MLARANRYLNIVWAPYLLIALVSGAVWGHTIRYEFVWDDREFIQELTSIRSLKNIPQMFYTLEAQSSFPQGFKLFRPLRTAQYAVLYWLGDKEAPQPWLFHLANILWHAAAAMLLFSVTLRLLQGLRPDQALERRRWLSLWTALAFAIHPVVSEVVCWTKSLDDAMAAVFTLATLQCLLDWDGKKAGYTRALLWFALAVYSKISAVPFALAAFLIFRYPLHIPWRRACRLTSGFLAVASIFMIHRHLVIGRSSQTAPISGSYAQTLVDMFPVVPKYLRLLCGLPPFSIDYSFMPGHCPVLSGPVLFGFALLTLALMVAGFAMRKPDHRLLGLGLAWVGLFLIPVSNLMPMMQYMAERFLYLPLIGWLWVTVLLLNRFPRWQASSALGVLTVGLWAGLAWDRSFLWRDEVTLFVQSSQLGPRTQRVENNAVAAIFSLPQIRAMFELDRQERILQVVGSLPADRGEAIRQTLNEAHRLFPEDETVSSALAIVYALSGQVEHALPLFEAAVRKSPANARYWVNLGKAHLELKDWKGAEEALSRALALQPNLVDAWKAASHLWWQQQNYPAALRAFQKLKSLEPNQPEHERWIKQTEEKLQHNERS